MTTDNPTTDTSNMLDTEPTTSLASDVVNGSPASGPRPSRAGDGLPEADHSSAIEGPDDDPETFPRAYVEQLRQENAGYRQKAGRAEEALSRLLETTVRSAAADHLADPADLLAFGDAEELLDPDGWPDADRIIAAAKSLASEKSHLAPRRPRGDIGQGATPTGDSVNLAAILKARAS